MPAGDVTLPPVGAGLNQGIPFRVDHQPASIRDHQVPTRSQDASELRHHRRKVPDMGQRQRTDDEIHVIVRDGEAVQVTLEEDPVRNPGPRLRQHHQRTVDADHPMPERGEVLGMPTRTARGIECDTDRQGVDDLPDDRLLDVDETVARLVVVTRPTVVPVRGRDRVHRDGLTELVGAL
jgi:hypothetical protein